MPSPNASDPLRTTDHVPEPSPEVVTTDDLPVGEPTVTYHPPPAAPEAPVHEAVPVVPGYEVEGVLGRGGMGVVWKARHVALKRTVALKMILLSGNAGPRELARFRAEAEAVARLQHPNIVQVFEVGQAEGHPYCALEFVEGGSLAAKLNGKPLPPREAAKLVEALARAMQLAHSRNVVHRDLKPANVLLQELATDEHRSTQKKSEERTGSSAIGVHPCSSVANYAPKITDFGLARQLDEDSGVTQAGAVMGTPSYMAPEQASGRAHEAGPAADTYALGAILYECLCGRPPFRGETVMATLDQVRTQEPVPPSRWQAKVPLDVETICLKCLRKEPEARYASAAELADDLGRYLRGEPIRARPVGTAERVVKWVKRRPAIAVLLALVVFVTLGGLAGITWAYRDARYQEGLVREQRDTALKEKARADDRAEETRRQLAFSKVGLAEAAWREGHAGMAQDHLDAVPADLRQWEWHYLKRTSEGSLFTLRGHTSSVRGVAFSPDGQRLATGSRDHTVRVWDARTGQQLALKGHTGSVHSVAFSPDGQHLATGSGGSDVQGRPLPEEVMVWDARTGQEVLVLKGLRGRVTSLAFSPDGQRLATAGRAPSFPTEFGQVQVWDARSGQELLALQGHTGSVQGVAFCPDGQRLATVSGDPYSPDKPGEVKVWEARTGQELLSLKEDTGYVMSVAFSPDGQRLATTSKGTAKVWDSRTGKELLAFKGHTYQGITHSIQGLTFSPDGRRLAGGSDSRVKVWDAGTGQELRSLKGHTSNVSSVAFSPDGQRLATASSDKTAKVWDARSVQELLSLEGHTSWVSSVAFSPDNQRLATASGDRTAKVWDARTGQQLLTLRGHKDRVEGVAFSPDGQRLATASSDKTAKVWDAGTGQELLALKGHGLIVTSVAFSPDGQRLATGGRDKTARVWDACTGQELLVLGGHIGFVGHVAFSPDGQRLATVSGDPYSPDKPGEVKMWEARTGQELLFLKGDTGSVTRVAFSPDGQFLATGSREGMAKVWDAGTGQELRSLKGHTRNVSSVAFSPDGQRLATGGDDGTKIWDVRRGQELFFIQGHTDRIMTVTFSPDGHRLATGGVDRSAKVWDASPPQNSPDAEELLIRRHRTAFDPAWHSAEARRHEQARQWFAATFHVNQLLQHQADVPDLPEVLLRLHAREARWSEVLADLDRILTRAPERVDARHWQALVLLTADRPEEYRRLCAAQVQRHHPARAVLALWSLPAAFTVPHGLATVAAVRLSRQTPTLSADRLRVVRTAVLAPDALARPAHLLELTAGAAPWLRGAALLRAGRPAEAVPLLTTNTWAGSQFFLALAEHARGRPAEAMQAASRALRWLGAPSKEDPKRTNGEAQSWDQRLEVDLLRREVEAKLGPIRVTPTTPPPMEPVR